MLHKKNFSLKEYNTFGIDVLCTDFYEITLEDELLKLIEDRVFEKKFLLMGGGSNMLFTENFEGTVVYLNIQGTQILEENENEVVLRSQAGENWHQFVQYCVSKGWGGLENLSLIPGNVGTAPIQNIGAYGVEVKEVIERVWIMDLFTGKKEAVSAEQCQFDYRNSIFKNEWKGKKAVLAVDFKLNKKHELKTTYGAIQQELEQMGVSQVGIAELSRAVINIRSSKLPDPKELGNCGSFFKNPVVHKSSAEALLNKYAEMPFYPLPNDQVKIPAGWLIEQAGWKGKREGNVGMHAKQALVLVNYGGASGPELWAHAQKVQASVMEKFGVWLEPEVNVI